MEFEVQISDYFDWKAVETDVVLIDNGKEHKAHKLLLVASSPYFKKMFGGQFAESRTKTVSLNLPAQQLGVILAFIYKQKVALTVDNIIECFIDADYLQMSTLKNVIKDSISFFAKAETVLPLLLKALLYQQTDLIEVLQDKMKTCWNLVHKDPEVLSIPPEIVFEVVTSKAVYSSMSPEALFNSILHYLLPRKSEERTVAIFSKISFKGIPSQLLKRLIEEIPSFRVPLDRLIEVVESHERKCIHCHQVIDTNRLEVCLKAPKTNNFFGNLNNAHQFE